MPADLTFKEAVKILKHGETDPKLIEAVDQLSAGALIVAPLALGLPAVTAGLGLLGLKNQLTSTGKYVLEKLTKKKDASVVDAQRRMEAAHAILAYAAFFEALEEKLPTIWKTLDINPDDKRALLDNAKANIEARAVLSDGASKKPAFSEEPRVGFPHPAESFETQTTQLRELYAEMTEGFLRFLSCLRLANVQAAPIEYQLRNLIQQLPQDAVECYQAQYFNLAVTFEDFFIWSNLQQHKKTQTLLKKMPNHIKKQVALARASDKKLDVGFAALRRTIDSLPKQITAGKVATAISELANLYRDAIDQPIISEKGAADEGPQLAYPPINKAFIPQAFRVLRYGAAGKDKLEDEDTWNVVPVRNDLGPFLLSLFRSPATIDSPVVVLGHPGSGKSLLTQVLSAVLMSERLFTTIRVKLRDVNADQDIDAQIRQQIVRDTGRETNWAELTDHMPQPALVFFDGYDELLQASGRVFSGYIPKVQSFQQRELAARHKPVRTVVTSRITLIDKAELAPGTTVIRLEDFDETKRDEWIALWNQVNAPYFAATKCQPFELPAGDDKILPLAAQPLLLLMLAIYDSDKNPLRQRENLDRTVLYDSLLRRFVQRERVKDIEYQQLPAANREFELDREMERLGVAAIGMFNRRSLHIKAPDLDSDIQFFDIERQVPSTPGLRLSQAELLLGSFFFVHRARSSSTPVKSSDGQETAPPDDGRDQEQKAEFAFEFLHNTFGECLTADFILRRVLEEIDAVEQLETSPKTRKEYDRKLNESTGLSKLWFAAMMYAPLHQRPAILEMMRQWLPHKLRVTKRSPESFFRILELLVNTQLNRILTASALPPLMSGAERASVDPLPLLGHSAIYSLNLVLLRTVVSPSGFDFDERALQESPDGCRAWDRLTNLWRSWFSLESLARASAILSARREGEVVKIRANENFTAEPSRYALDMVLSVSNSLADEITAGLAGYVTYDTGSVEMQVLEKAAEHLARNMIHIELDVRAKAMAHIRSMVQAGAATEEHGSRPRREVHLGEVGLVESAERALASDKPNAWLEFIRTMVALRYDKDLAYLFDQGFRLTYRAAGDRWRSALFDAVNHVLGASDPMLRQSILRTSPFLPELTDVHSADPAVRELMRELMFRRL